MSGMLGDDTQAAAQAARAFHRAVCAALDLEPDRRGVRKLICDALDIQMARYGQALLASRGSIGSVARWVARWNDVAVAEGLPTVELVSASGWEVRTLPIAAPHKRETGSLLALAKKLRESPMYDEIAAGAADL